MNEGMKNLVSETLKKSTIFDWCPEILPRVRFNFFNPSFNLTVEDTVLFGYLNRQK